MFFTSVLAHRVAFFGYLILLFAFLGLLINLGSIALLFHKNRPSLFHHLLKILAVVDCLVLVCCLVSYGIPDIVPGYLERHHPTVIQWILPLSHMSVMTSVYCTILISFERYVRICFFCQLRTTRLITPENFKFYVVGLVLGPVLFYLPKFFEVETAVHSVDTRIRFNCSTLDRLFQLEDDVMLKLHETMKPDYLQELAHLGQICGMNTSRLSPDLPTTLERPIEPEDLHQALDLHQTLVNTTTVSEDPAEALFGDPNFASTASNVSYVITSPSPNSMIRNVTFTHQIVTIQETKLRQNPLYYRFYYVYLNALFGTLIPLASLLYLNVFTVRALRQIITQDKIMDGSSMPFLLRKSVSHDNLGAIMENSLYSGMKRSLSSCTINGNEATARRESMDPVAAGTLTEIKSNVCVYKKTGGEDQVTIHTGTEVVENNSSGGGSSHRTRSGSCASSNRKAKHHHHHHHQGRRRRQSLMITNDVRIEISECREPMISPSILLKSRSKSSLSKPREVISKAGSKSNPNLQNLHKHHHHQQHHASRPSRPRTKRLLSFSDPMPDLDELAGSPPGEEQFSHCNRKGARRSTVMTVLEFGNGSSSNPHQTSGSSSSSGSTNGNQKARLAEVSEVLVSTTMNRVEEEEQGDKFGAEQERDKRPLNKKVNRRASIANGMVDRFFSRGQFDEEAMNRSTPALPQENKQGQTPTSKTAHKSHSALTDHGKAERGGGGQRAPQPIKRAASRTVSAESSASLAPGVYHPRRLSSLNQSGAGSPSIYTAAEIAASDRLRRHSRAPSTYSRRGTVVTEAGSLALTLNSMPCVNERAQEKRLTRISIFIVWLFLFCHVWKLVPTIYEAVNSSNGTEHADWPFAVLLVEHVSHVLITVNSAINFLIYLFL